MRAEALAWVQAALDVPITDAAELPGGITSTMLRLTDASGRKVVLRLMTEDPWRADGSELTRREQAALRLLSTSAVPAPQSIELDSEGAIAGVAMHLMSWLPGVPTPGTGIDERTMAAMAEMLVAIHSMRPAVPFPDWQSWAREEKWVVPRWAAHPESWERGFEFLARGAPSYRPAFLHRDFSHRNLLWTGGQISGVVDWVEASTGPVWLDVAHAATNLAMEFGAQPAKAFVAEYASRATEPMELFWLVLDAVGFLAAPGEEPLFGSSAQLQRLDAWVHELLG